MPVVPIQVATEMSIAGLFCLIVPVFLFVVLGGIFWIWMLVDCLTKESSQGNGKIVWFLVIFFLFPLGAILYYFIRRAQRMRENGQ